MRRSTKVIIGVGLASYAFALSFTFFAGTRGALAKVERVLDRGVAQVSQEMMSAADNILSFVGDTVVRACADPYRSNMEEMQRFCRSLAVDEMNLVGSNGLVIASSDPLLPVGSDFNPESTKRAINYSLLYRGTHQLIEPRFRSSVEDPTVRRKYCGTAFKKGKAFVQVGVDESRMVHDFEYFYNHMATGWYVGEFGSYLLVNPKTGVIISSLDEYEIGRSVYAIAPELSHTCREDGKTHTCTIRGEFCYFRDMLICGHRVITMLPQAEVVSFRKVLMVIVFVVMTAFIGLFAKFYSMVERQREREREFFEADRKRTENDMMMAKSIQSNALPSVFPPYPAMVDRMDIFAEMHTAKEVGGDFYDFFFAGIDKLAIVIADVSGKGVPAAMFMMRAKTTLQNVLRGGRDVAEAVTEVNERISIGNDMNMFVTAWVGVIDLRTGEVEYVNAGHNPPIVYRHDGLVWWLKPVSGPPLAAMSGVKYKKGKFTLQLDDGIFLYTDGVTEANNAAFELYGEERLKAALTSATVTSADSSRSLCGSIGSSLREFVNGAEQADDITMLAFRLKGVERQFACTSDGMAAAIDYMKDFYDDAKPAVIMDEIVANILHYSGAQSFSIKFIRSGTEEKMVFSDDGKAFGPMHELSADVSEPINLDDGDLDWKQLSFTLVRKMSKSISYSRVENRNVLTVTLAEHQLQK